MSSKRRGGKFSPIVAQGLNKLAESEQQTAPAPTIMPTLPETDINKLSDDVEVLANEINESIRTVNVHMRAIGARFHKIKQSFGEHGEGDWKKFCKDHFPVRYELIRQYMATYQNLQETDFKRLENKDQSFILRIGAIPDAKIRSEVIGMVEHDAVTVRQLDSMIREIRQQHQGQPTTRVVESQGEINKEQNPEPKVNKPIAGAGVCEQLLKDMQELKDRYAAKFRLEGDEYKKTVRKLKAMW